MKQFKVNQVISVYLTDDQQKEVTLSYLYDYFKWQKSFYIANGKVYNTIVYSTSHTFISEEFVRDADEQDYFIAGIIKILNQNNFTSN